MPSLPPPHPSLPSPPQSAVSSSSRAYSSYYNSHYLQAYSSPSLQPANSNASIQHNPTFNTAPTGYSNSSVPRLIWYEPGNNRCSHPGCTFTGSKKTVETHMMDRHLIYPPGWDKQKKKSDWDADPSLKGCAYMRLFLGLHYSPIFSENPFLYKEQTLYWIHLRCSRHG